MNKMAKRILSGSLFIIVAMTALLQPVSGEEPSDLPEEFAGEAATDLPADASGDSAAGLTAEAAASGGAAAGLPAETAASGGAAAGLPAEIAKADHLSIDDALTMLDEYPSDNYQDMQHEIQSLQKCAGLFLHDSDTGKVYTAEVSFYYHLGSPYLSLTYDNFMGELSDAPVEASSDKDYLFFSSPAGKFVSREIAFSVWLGEDSMHIKWGETSDYILRRSNGSAEETESKKPPFAESEHYTSLTESLANALKGSDTHFYYDEEALTLYCYAASNMSRENTIAYYQSRTDEWKKLMESLGTITEKAAQAVTLYIRDGIYDLREAHCSILLVEELNAGDKYFAQDTLAMITDGEVEYSVYQEKALSDFYSIIGNIDDYANEGTSTSDYTSPDSYTGTGATSGEKNALQRAKDYLEYTAFSYESLIEQLEFEGYSYSEAVYGADHCGADWYRQAVRKAKDYLDYTSFSFDGLVEQLEYEGFTYDQALYGAQQAY